MALGAWAVDICQASSEWPSRRIQAALRIGRASSQHLFDKLSPSASLPTSRAVDQSKQYDREETLMLTYPLLWRRLSRSSFDKVPREIMAHPIWHLHLSFSLISGT